MERKLLDAITEAQNAITLIDRGRTRRNINKSIEYMQSCISLLLEIRNELNISLDKPK